MYLAEILQDVVFVELDALFRNEKIIPMQMKMSRKNIGKYDWISCKISWDLQPFLEYKCKVGEYC